MAIKPGPVLVTLASSTLYVDSIAESYDVEFFDRVEFDHERLKSAPLSTGTTPTIVSMLGGRPAEIVIDCALTGMSGSYVPRPLTPNSLSDYNNIKQRFNIRRFQLVGGSAPESASLGAAVDEIQALRVTSRILLARFQNRIAMFQQPIAYETLIAAQADNFTSLYLTSGITFTAPGVGTLSNVLVTDFQETHEFVIYDENSNATIYKGFTATVEYRTITAASA